MKNLQNVRYAIATVAAVAAVAAFAPKADAQTQAFSSTVTVQNTLTLAKIQDLNFGTLIVSRGAATTSTIVLDPTKAVGAAYLPADITSNTPSYIAVISAAAVSPAEVTVAAGAPGATINVNIPAVSITAPTAGLNAFALSAWQYSWNGGPATAIVPGVAEQVVFDNTFNGGVNNLKVGATLGTTTGGTAYADVAHVGAFNVVFSY